MVEQGNLIKVSGISNLALVISKNLYNETGNAIILPVLKAPIDSTFLIDISVDGETLYVVCDSPRQLDLKTRGCSIRGEISQYKLIYITDMVQSLVDYY